MATLCFLPCGVVGGHGSWQAYATLATGFTNSPQQGNHAQQ